MSCVHTETTPVTPRAAAINLFALIGQTATWYLKGYRPLKELMTQRREAGRLYERRVMILQKHPSIGFGEEMTELLFERTSADGVHLDTIFFLTRRMRILRWRGRCTMAAGIEAYGQVELYELNIDGLAECFAAVPERFGRMLDAILELHTASFAAYRDEYAILRANARTIASVKAELVPD